MPGEIRKIFTRIVQYYVILGIVFFVYFFDRMSKFYAEKLLLKGQSIPVLKNIIHATLIHNTGAAFGMFREASCLFVIIAVLAAVLIIHLFIKHRRNLAFLEKMAVSFIFGGILGNLTDRLLYGHVIDFIDFRIWPVFNIADSFITIGALILARSVLLRGKKPVTRNQ